MSIDYDAHEALKRRAIPCQYPECHGHFCQGVECDGPPEMACTSGEDSDESEGWLRFTVIAVLLVGVIGVLVFAFADPFLALVRK